MAKIVRRGHSGEVENRTPVQRLVDTMLDRAEANDPSVEYVIWMPSLESLLLPRDPTDGPRTASALTHRYRTHRVQPFDTPTLTVWVSPATGAAAPAGAPSYAADPHRTHHPPLNHPMIGDDVPARSEPGRQGTAAHCEVRRTQRSLGWLGVSEAPSPMIRSIR